MKIAIVTGASRGIGKSIAEKLIQDGFYVIGTYNSTSVENEQKNPHQICYFRCDVSDYFQVEKMFEYITEKYNRLDVVVNCAGVSHFGILQDMTQIQIQKVIQINLCGTIFVCQKAAQLMVRNHSGSIVNISSIWGTNGASCETVYSASKGAVNTFTKALSKELAPSGIRVNAVCPGIIKTDMMKIFSDKEIEQLRQDTPIGRIGVPEDVSNLVSFIVNDNSSFITGQIITVDGGFSV